MSEIKHLLKDAVNYPPYIDKSLNRFELISNFLHGLTENERESDPK